VLDGVPVNIVFFRQRGVPGEDVVPTIGEALTRFVEGNEEYQDTDVVYAQWLWSGGASALELRRRFGWPVAAIARGSDMHQWHAVHQHCRPYVEKVIREADCVLTNCEYLRDCVEEIAPGAAARVRVVYNGVNAEGFRPAGDRAELRRELKLEGRSRLLLFCGTIEQRKGIPELAEAWGKFSESHPEWTLLIVGRAVDKSLHQRLREIGGGRVVFTGQLPHARVAMYMRAADAYVQPSRLEGLANATMEAMATGLPVITTSACGQRELIRDGENGWLVPPGDAAALGRALEELAADREKGERLGREARRTVETKFNPVREAARLAQILSETAGRAARPGQAYQPGDAGATVRAER
jgi:glycosyltransferase involved in cell wall biosynthesis